MVKLPLKLRIAHLLKRAGAYDVVMNAYDALDLWTRKRRNLPFSDHGEDLFVFHYFGNKREGFYVDVGANHPFRVSNTYRLYLHGWRGVTIEPIPRLLDKHRKARPRDTQVHCGVSSAPGSMTFFELTPGVMSTFSEDRARELVASGMARLVRECPVDVRTLADIAAEHVSDQRIDLLNIDTEGHDLEVLRGVDWAVLRPELIICETHPEERAPIDELLAEHGYRVLERLGYNTVYVAEGPPRRPFGSREDGGAVEDQLSGVAPQNAAR